MSDTLSDPRPLLPWPTPADVSRHMQDHHSYAAAYAESADPSVLLKDHRGIHRMMFDEEPGQRFHRMAMDPYSERIRFWFDHPDFYFIDHKHG